MPTSIKRKKAGASGTGASKINAAPSLGSEADGASEEPTAPQARPDLLSALKGQFGPTQAAPAGASNTAGKGKTAEKPEKKKDDYEKFMEEMGDIL